MEASFFFGDFGYIAFSGDSGNSSSNWSTIADSAFSYAFHYGI